MSVPAHSYGSFAPRPTPWRGGTGVVNFALGLLVVFGLVVYAAWLIVAAVTALIGSDQPAASEHVGVPSAIQASAIHAAVPPVQLPGPPTPSGSTLPFDQLWISGDGNTIVAGAPVVGISALTGESMIQIPVTLTNNGEQAWNPESTAFAGTLNHAPAPESTEGDWMYRSLIVPHTSVTLTKVFVGTPGHFTLTVKTPHDTAAFAGPA